MADSPGPCLSGVAEIRAARSKSALLIRQRRPKGGLDERRPRAIAQYLSIVRSASQGWSLFVLALAKTTNSDQPRGGDHAGRHRVRVAAMPGVSRVSGVSGRSAVSGVPRSGPPGSRAIERPGESRGRAARAGSTGVTRARAARGLALQAWSVFVLPSAKTTNRGRQRRSTASIVDDRGSPRRVANTAWRSRRTA